MPKIWTKNGKLVLFDGKLKHCDDCPCDGAVETSTGCANGLCEDDLVPNTIESTIGAGFIDNGCADGACDNDIPGTYTLGLFFTNADGVVGSCSVQSPCQSFSTDCASWCYTGEFSCDDDVNPWTMDHILVLKTSGFLCYRLRMYNGIKINVWNWSTTVSSRVSCIWSGLSLSLDTTNSCCSFSTGAFGGAPCTADAPATISLSGV